MFNKLTKSFGVIVIFFKLTCLNVNAEIISEIQINGNERIANETILMFSKINIGDDINEKKLNEKLKNLYDTNFFKNVTIGINDKVLRIIVEENPIIENIFYNGIKSNTLKEKIIEKLKLKPRSSYNEVLLNDDKLKIISTLKNSGYYFSSIEIKLEEIGKNKVDLIFDINLGKKAKIKKISFIGNKIFKDGKLYNLIVSEEYKFLEIYFWKKFK